MNFGTTLSSLLSFLLISSVSYATDTVSVVDENQHPVPNATVLLGFEPGNPFKGNEFNTDANGTAALPADWKAALPVTVQATGYITTTLPVVSPGQMTVQLTHQEGANQIEVKGMTDGYGNLVDDGNVHFGLVIPAVNRAQILGFDLSMVISPQVDTISILGKDINIPSNISLPDQTVTYIFPFEINKPEYRSYVRDPGPLLMTATHGSFPLQKVADALQKGKSIFEVINFFKFIEGGQKSIDLKSDMTGVDLTVNQTPFNGYVTVQAPKFDSKQVMVSLALNEQNGLLYPTDMKRFTSNQNMQMKSTGSSPTVLSILLVNSNPFIPGFSKPAIPPLQAKPSVAQSFAQLSFAMQPGASQSPEFLPLIDKPTLDMNTNVLKMNMPSSMPDGIKAAATYMVFEEIQTFDSGSVKTEQRTRLWEVWSTAWLPQVELPKITFNKNSNRTYRWEVMFLAQPAAFKGGSARINGVDLNSVTHVTRNTLDL